MLSAAVAWGVILTVITEGLSRFHFINIAGILLAWTIVNGAIALSLFRHSFPKQRSRQNSSQEIVIGLKTQIWHGWKEINANSFLRFSLLSLISVIAMTGALVMLVPPNNWDAMTYHMSRVMHWIQNQSVAHYPTHNLRQLDPPPWSTFASMHLQILGGGDRLTHLVQWCSMLGCFIGTSLIAQQLGASLVGQLLSSVVCVTIPMGLLQSVSAQNDYVVSFWLLCFTYNVLQIIQQKSNWRNSRNQKIQAQNTFKIFYWKKTNSSRNLLRAGASLGLAILTKGTAYVYAFPLCILWVLWLFKQESFRVWNKRFYQQAILSFLPVVLLNVSHWWRNIQVFHTPLGISAESTKNQLFTPVAIASNMIRNSALHLPVALQSINASVERGILWLHDHALGLSANDARTTFMNTAFQVPDALPTQGIYLHEDISGNLLHLILIGVAIALYLTHRRAWNRQCTIYLLNLLGMFLLYNTLIAWQPWAVRLHLPFFVLASAFIGTVLSRVWCRVWVHYVLVAMLTVSALPYLVFNASRPLAYSPYFQQSVPSVFALEPIERYFVHRPYLQDSYIPAVDAVLENECYDIGLYIGGDSWDYPLWALMNAKSPHPVRFRFVNVWNVSKDIVLNDNQAFLPCAVFAIDQKRQTLKRKLEVVYPEIDQPVVYRRIMRSPRFHVYLNKRLMNRG